MYLYQMKKLTLLLVFISTLCFSQPMTDHEKIHLTSDLTEEKIYFLDELNYARQYPSKYGDDIGVNLDMFDSSGILTEDKLLSLFAQDYAEKLLKIGGSLEMSSHSKMEYYESILWCYDPCVGVKQFIIDAGVPDLGHRKHMLASSERSVGIGIAKGWVGGYYRSYIVILTEDI